MSTLTNVHASIEVHVEVSLAPSSGTKVDIHAFID